MAALGVLVVGAVLALVVGKVAQRYFGRPGRQSEQLAKLIARAASWVVMVGAFFWALTILGLGLGWLTITVVLVFIVAALTAKPLVENLISSVELTARSSFGVGDEIEIDEFTGEVLEFTTHSTVLRLRDGRRVHMANRDVIRKTIIVITTEQARRSTVEVAITWAADIASAETAILEALADVDVILDHPQPDVRSRSLGPGIELSVRFWHQSDIGSGEIAVDQAVRAIKSALDEAGVALAPMLDVEIESSTDDP